VEPIFSQDAGHVLDELEKDPANDQFVDAVWEVIDLITEHPGSARARRRGLQTPGGHRIWLVPIPHRYEEETWIILWQPRDDDVLIAYIGPEDFRSGRT
jgi:hypothetical protein